MNRYKKLRLHLGMTQEQFGKLFSPPAAKGIVSRWESGVSVPNATRMKTMFELLDKVKTNKRTMIPIAEVRQMLMGEVSDIRKEGTDEMDDPAAPMFAIMWLLSQYEEGKPWDIFVEDEDEEE